MREGIMAMISPLIDTIVVCTMTALTTLVTQTHLDANVGEEPRTIAVSAIAVSMLADCGPLLPKHRQVADPTQHQS